MSKIKIEYEQLDGIRFNIVGYTNYECNTDSDRVLFYRNTMSKLLNNYGLLDKGHETVLVDDVILYDRNSYRNLKEDLLDYYSFITDNYEVSLTEVNNIDLNKIG